MKNVKELRNGLIGIFSDLKKNPENIKLADTLTKTARAIMNSAIIQLRYAKDRKVKPQIGFLNCK